ncbi:ATPase, F1 complex, gamma subunit [Candidatus Magnetoovum chiemensis]|nr:ATPase, F1 complex, gamma subunit [Candidatus Magnetoovum chiemensis]
MPSLREIRNRISSVKKTGKITRAMEMISAAKLRKAQNIMNQAKPYSEQLKTMLLYASSGVEKQSYPLLTQRQKKAVEIIVISSDKGLCGAFNSNVIKNALNVIRELEHNNIKYTITTIGKKARDIFARRKKASDLSGLTQKDSGVIRDSIIDYSKNVEYKEVQKIATDILSLYAEEKIDEVIIIHNEFVSIASQKTKITKLIPVEMPVETIEDAQTSDKPDTPMFLFEPSEAEVLSKLLPKYIENQIYTLMLESRSAEEAARMLAMQNASSNTEDIIASLTLQFNKARQAAITTELIDIVNRII